MILHVEVNKLITSDDFVIVSIHFFEHGVEIVFGVLSVSKTPFTISHEVLELDLNLKTYSGSAYEEVWRQEQ